MPSLQTCLIAGVSASLTLLSAVVAFAGLSNQPHGIQVMAASSIIYGVAFAWLESGYILLRSDSSLPIPAVYSLFVIIRIAVLVTAGVVGALFDVTELPLWQFMVISAGLSSGYAVMSCLRSGKLNAIAVAYLAGALGAALLALLLHVTDTVQLLFLYSVLTFIPTSILALWRCGGGSWALAKSLFAKTRSFLVDLPITSLVENGDRMLIAIMADHRALVAYNSVKVFFGIQREFNKLLKQLMFHHIFDEVSRGGGGRIIGRFFLMVFSTQALAMLVGVVAFLHFQRGFPPAMVVVIALCVSTAYTLTSTHAVAVASALQRPSLLFTWANVLSLASVLVALVLLTGPALPSSVQPKTVYAVAGCYLLFYAAKTLILFSSSVRKLIKK